MGGDEDAVLRDREFVSVFGIIRTGTGIVADARQCAAIAIVAVNRIGTLAVDASDDRTFVVFYVARRDVNRRAVAVDRRVCIIEAADYAPSAAFEPFDAAFTVTVSTIQPLIVAAVPPEVVL